MPVWLNKTNKHHLKSTTAPLVTVLFFCSSTVQAYIKESEKAKPMLVTDEETLVQISGKVCLSVCQLFGPKVWSRLKYLNIY